MSVGKTCETCMWCNSNWICNSPDSPMSGCDIKPCFSCDRWQSDMEGQEDGKDL